MKFKQLTLRRILLVFALANFYLADSQNDSFPDSLEIIGNNIWVRTEPSTGEVIMKLNDGDQCKVLQKGKYEEIRGMKDYWYQIEFEDRTGWVFGSQTNVKFEERDLESKEDSGSLPDQLKNNISDESDDEDPFSEAWIFSPFFILLLIIQFAMFTGICYFIYKLVSKAKSKIGKSILIAKDQQQKAVDERASVVTINKISLIEILSDFEGLRKQYNSTKKSGLKATNNYYAWLEFCEDFKSQIIPKILEIRQSPLIYSSEGLSQDFIRMSSLIPTETWDLITTKRSYISPNKFERNGIVLANLSVPRDSAPDLLKETKYYSGIQQVSWILQLNMDKELPDSIFVYRTKLRNNKRSYSLRKSWRVKIPIVRKFRGFDLCSTSENSVEKIDIEKLEKLLHFFEDRYPERLFGLTMEGNHLVVRFAQGGQLFYPQDSEKSIASLSLSDKLHDDLTYLEQLFDELSLFKEVIK